MLVISLVSYSIVNLELKLYIMYKNSNNIKFVLIKFIVY